ncbi:Oidioi.mRNA.OKI2018_I69.XSR.g15214.t1.cds [Oikopleura dioica]|uniref:Oidioi.mRNA.OKI2018_I69.XSR.g15214.t1.cds n=1 Tax=Oikopleura dioica TaxID=34765 RepID=A0ABN7SC47_OIKDI|nr:Oidioi.mRNA.OKI2018_I69.XSR.g15214.t1.cds [Oikopleura dioica]
MLRKFRVPRVSTLRGKSTDVDMFNFGDLQFEDGLAIQHGVPANKLSAAAMAPLAESRQNKDKLDNFIHVSDVQGSSQSIRIGINSNRVETNVNRNPILVDLHDRFQVDIQQMKKNCHLFYKDHRYGAKYVQLIEPEEYLARTNFIIRNILKIAKRNHVDTNILVGKMITRAPLLLDPKLSERSFGGGYIEENWKKNLALLNKEIGLTKDEISTTLVRCPGLLTYPITRMQKAIDTFKNLGDLVENVSLYFSDDDLRKMVLLDPDILLENSEHIKATARIFFMHDFTLVESKAISTQNPSCLTSKLFSIDVTSNRYTDLDKQLFFLLHEAGFTTKQIRYNPLLLTTEKAVITERLLFLRETNRMNFDINAEGSPEHVPIDALCQVFGFHSKIILRNDLLESR